MAGKTMIPLLAFAAWSGTGKTTLLKQLIPALCARGIRPVADYIRTMIWMLISRAKIAMSCARLARHKPSLPASNDGP